MPRHLFRFAALVLAVPLLLGACQEKIDPVKPKVAPPVAVQGSR